MDQQQRLQLATLAENRQLKGPIQRISSFLESSSSTQKRQAAKKMTTCQIEEIPRVLKSS